MGLGTESVLDGVVHPALHATLGRFFPTLVEIQTATETRRPNGEIVESWETVLVVYGNLAEAGSVVVERRTGEMTRVPEEIVLNLDGYYPQIAATQRVVAEGRAWNITAVVHDSLNESTQLKLERVEH